MALIAAAAAGCGVGAGEELGKAELRVTRDRGAELLDTGRPPIREADSVIDLLDRETEIETRYGGGFVQSIDGLAGGSSGGQAADWFYYANGIEAGVGAAELDPRDGDSIWWDYHEWGSVMRTPAVVGSFPQPFLSGYRGRRWPTTVECLGVTAACDAVTAALRSAGAEPSAGAGDDGAIRVLVGPWGALRDLGEAGLLAAGPERSGVFARFDAAGGGGWRLAAFDGSGREAASFRGGLVAALRTGERPPVWLITGSDAGGVAAAAAALDERTLEGAFALALPHGAEPMALPAEGQG